VVLASPPPDDELEQPVIATAATAAAASQVRGLRACARDSIMTSFRLSGYRPQ
jgi:hypothetical protein